MDKNKVHLDDILSKFGVLSPYQFQALLLIGMVFFVNELHTIGFVFFAEEVPYRCQIDQCESRYKQFDPPWYNFTSPSHSKECYKYVAINNEACQPQNFNTSAVIRCHQHIYENEDTFVSELGCEDWKRTFVGTVRSIGLMIGLFIQGLFSDRFGRKTAIIFSALMGGVFGLAKSFCTSYWTFISLETLDSMFGDTCSPAFIMSFGKVGKMHMMHWCFDMIYAFSIEIMSNKDRIQPQMLLSVLYALGGITMAVTAYGLKYWRNVIRVIYAPSFIFIFYYFVMDESVRWLLSKGRKDEAIALLKKMAKKNKVVLDDCVIENLQCEHSEDKLSPLSSTFRSKKVMKRFIVCLVWWISCTFICFGILINVVSLAGNKYINFSLMSLLDLPTCFAVVFILKRYKRKKPLLTSFTLAGLLCIIQPFIPKDTVWLSSGLYLVGKILSTFSFVTVYLYTSEIFPTHSRNSLHALCSAIGRVGSIVAPMTPLLNKYIKSLPTLLIGVTSLLAGATVLLVPDIADDSLPDNIKEAESIGNNRKIENSNKII